MSYMSEWIYSEEDAYFIILGNQAGILGYLIAEMKAL